MKTKNQAQNQQKIAKVGRPAFLKLPIFYLLMTDKSLLSLSHYYLVDVDFFFGKLL